MAPNDKQEGEGPVSQASGVDARERAVSAREETVHSRERAVIEHQRAVGEREISAGRREELLRLREELLRAREEAAEAKSGQERLMQNLKEANERLILTSIRSQELAEVADDARRQLERSERVLRDTAAFRERLIGIVGHDLRTPLSAIQMVLDVLLREHQGDAQTKNLLRIQRCAQRMEELIAQILDFTRAHVGGGLQLQLRPMSLKEVCRQIIEELELGYSAPGRFSCEFHGDLDGVGDPDRLAQVISNLGQNAMAYGAPQTPILVRVRDDGAQIILEMNNKGHPIPSNRLPTLFDPFHQGTKDKREGLGLGLYISRQIVLAHGGTIDVRSNAVEGTTFSVRLPRRVVAGQNSIA